MLVSVIQFVTEIMIIIRRYYYIKHLFQLVHISTILICKVKINVKKKQYQIKHLFLFFYDGVSIFYSKTFLYLF